MNAQVEKFITRAKEKEQKNIQRERSKVISQMGINPRDVTDEEYEEIKKYIHLYDAHYDSTESKLRTISCLTLILSIIGGVCCIITGTSDYEENLIVLGIIILFSGILQYLCTLIFTKISQNLTNINNSLKELLKSK